MTQQHSDVNPSAADTWRICTAHPSMRKLYPSQDDDESAREGEAAHWVFAEAMHGRTVAEGQIAPNGVIVTEQMIDTADMSRAHLAALPLDRSTIAIEQPVTIPRVHARCFGTPDVRAWGKPTFDGFYHLYIADLKYGHRYVDEYENWQLICYAAGLVPPSVDDRQVMCHLIIIQPRAYGRGGMIREWVVTLSDLRGHINRLAMAAAEALGPAPRCVPNPGCLDCSARHACPALQQDAYRSCAIVTKAEPLDLPPAAAGIEYTMLTDAAQRLAGRIKGLEEQLRHQITAGRTDTGYTLERTPGREAWLDSNAAIECAKLFNLDIEKPRVAITPNQARTLGMPADVVKLYAHRPGGSVNLIPSTDGLARRIFGKTAK